MRDKIEIKNPKVAAPFKLDGEVKDTHRELFEWLADQPDNTAPLDKALLILCTPRCGSTLFAEALNSSGLLGHCEEWFNYEYFNAYKEVLGREFILKDYVEFITRKSIRDTGVLCIKWHVGQLIAMNSDFDIGLESMDFDHIVYLYRRDKIAQSISLVKAIKSNQYRSYEAAQEPAVLTRHLIADAMMSVTKFDWFARKYLWGYVDAEYAYEDFLDLDHYSYQRVLKAMGKPPHTGLSTGRLKKQADVNSERAGDDFRRYILGEIQ
jgi:LPS sulfotransferase NodH